MLVDMSFEECQSKQVLLIKHFDIYEDIIDFDQQFVILWLPKDVALFGFVTVPLTY